MSISIGFVDHGIGFRGTTRAMIAYAIGLKQLNPDYTAILFYIKDSRFNNLSIMHSTEMQEIKIIPIQTYSEIENYPVDAIYHIYSGTEESIDWVNHISKPVIMHQCGYQPPMNKQHNGIFAYVSHWQNIRFASGKSEVLPHIIKEAPQTTLKTGTLRTTMDLIHHQ